MEKFTSAKFTLRELTLSFFQCFMLGQTAGASVILDNSSLEILDEDDIAITD